MTTNPYSLIETATSMMNFCAQTGARGLHGAEFYARPLVDRIREAAQRGDFSNRVVTVALTARGLNAGDSTFLGTATFWVDTAGMFILHGEPAKLGDLTDDVWGEVEFRLTKGQTTPFEIYGREWSYHVGLK